MSLYYKDKKSLSLRVGIFTVIVLIIFFISYSYLNDLFQRQKYTQIEIRFPNINNLEPGNSVSINGFKCGKVKKIRSTEHGVIVSTLVDLNFDLNDGTLFIIKESDLMGNHQIDIIPGDGKSNLDLSKTQEGVSREGLTDLIYRMNSMASNVERIFTKLENADKVVNNVNDFITSGNKTLDNINTIITNPNKNDIRSAIYHLNTTTRELSELLVNNKAQIQSLFINSDETFKKLNYTLTVVDSSIVYLNMASKKINQDDNTAGALLNDKQLYKNILKSSERVDSLLIDIKKNPRKYFKISVF
jgi:phospholipid/cholesterol/gamma-HCH transport system substrate-binding protein